jgi:16S rRNA C1402 (ribose-2'-O) methylase RsmI
MPGWRAAWWALLVAAGVVLTAFAFRGYLDPAALIDLANSRLC